MADLTAMFKQDRKYAQDLIVDPIELIKQLDEYIIGQHRAKRVLAIAVFQRRLRILQNRGAINLSTTIPKNNVMLLGKSGVGKTALVRALSDVIDCPLTVYDISGVTSSGYVGGKVENILSNHLVNTYREYAGERYPTLHSIMEIASEGILYMDEFDKCKIDRDRSGGKDVGGEGVQQELLKVLEDGIVTFTDRERPLNAFSEFDTTNLLCVCGGAFVGLEDIIKKRLGADNKVGFLAEVNTSKDLEKRNIIREVSNEDLMKYGFLPEILGRIPMYATLDNLEIGDLVRILTEPKNALVNQYIDMFSIFNIKLSFTQRALEKIAELALERKTGARALKSIIGKVMENYQVEIFDIPNGSSVELTEQDIVENYKL